MVDNGKKAKSKKLDCVDASPESKDGVEVVEYSAIKRMLGTLDRFLTKRFMLVVGLCTAVVSACIIALMVENSVFTQAYSSGGGAEATGGDLTTNVWLGALIVVAVFIMIVVTVINLRKQKKKVAKPEDV